MEIVDLRVPFDPQILMRFNIAPTSRAPIVRQDANGKRELAAAQWGLIAPWSSEPKSPFSTINARAETVATLRTYKKPFESKRCLVPATGFFEWQKLGPKEKQPYNIALADGELFAFAGLWERWGKGELIVDSFTIITTTPNALTETIHDRMPVILPRERYDEWLDVENHNVAAL